MQSPQFNEGEYVICPFDIVIININDLSKIKNILFLILNYNVILLNFC